VDDGVDQVLIDSKEDSERMLRFAEKYVPDVVSRIKCYQGERPIFDLHSIEDEIQKALQRNVQLKSGGYLMIDQTEAMTTIDVNTGGFIGHRNLEETIYKTNLEAAQAIARQLRLRNLGGIIIIDFIDMQDEEHKRQVMRALNKALDKDYARTHVSEVSELGLVEMTRKRTRESLEHVLCQTCPSCEGRGSVRTAESVCYEIFREIQRVSRLYTARELTVLASQDVIDLLLDEESSGLAELQSHTRPTIRLQVETLYTREQYDVVIT
jgi:ribonuclease G